MPYAGLKLWNSFINVTSTLDLLNASLLLHWKLNKFKKFVKDALLHFQSLKNNFTWDSFNFNSLELFNWKSKPREFLVLIYFYFVLFF